MEMKIEAEGTNKQGKSVKRTYTITEKNGKFTVKHFISTMDEGGISGTIGEFEAFDEAWQTVQNKIERAGLI